jgi:hypothetical protein
MDAGDGSLSIVARAGVRPTGMARALGIALTVAIIAAGGFILLSPRNAPPRATPMSSVSPGVIAQSNPSATSISDRSHLGADGPRKCEAFRQVMRHTAELQAASGGVLSEGQTRRLQAELDAAKAMQPTPLTPMQCGVAL